MSKSSYLLEAINQSRIGPLTEIAEIGSITRYTVYCYNNLQFHCSQYQ